MECKTCCCTTEKKELELTNTKEGVQVDVSKDECCCSCNCCNCSCCKCICC